MIKSQSPDIHKRSMKNDLKNYNFFNTPQYRFNVFCLAAQFKQILDISDLLTFIYPTHTEPESAFYLKNWEKNKKLNVLDQQQLPGVMFMEIMLVI